MGGFRLKGTGLPRASAAGTTLFLARSSLPDVPTGEREGAVEATVGAFPPPVRDLLVPLMMYKSTFLGDGFSTLVRNERDADARRTLQRIILDTLQEAIQLLDAMREWQKHPPEDDTAEELVVSLHRRAIEDLMVLKEGSAEAVILMAMSAPTAELRDRLHALADIDRKHTERLRALLGGKSLPQRLAAAERKEGRPPLGAHVGRRGSATLAMSIQTSLAAFQERGIEVARVVVSSEAHRHLRDERVLEPSGRVFGLGLDVDFGWEGECYALITRERMRLAAVIAGGEGV